MNINIKRVLIEDDQICQESFLQLATFMSFSSEPGRASGVTAQAFHQRNLLRSAPERVFSKNVFSIKSFPGNHELQGRPGITMPGKHSIRPKTNMKTRRAQGSSIGRAGELPLREKKSYRLHSRSYAKIGHIRQIL